MNPTTPMNGTFGARLLVLTVLAAGLIVVDGCFLLVTSGVRREVPAGARDASVLLLRPGEDVVAAWDGSVLQDGGRLALLTDHRVVFRDGDVTDALDLVVIDAIVVDEDDGVVDVKSEAGVHVRLPLRTLAERTAFAKLIEAEVRRAKREARSVAAPEAALPPAPQPSTSTTPAAPPSTP